MAKTKRAGAVTRTSTAPPTAGVPAAAPMRPVEADEAETAHVKQTDPHRTGADRTAVLKARVAAARQRHAHKAATGRALPIPPKPAAKPVARAAAKAKKKSAAKPAVTPPTSY